MRDSRDWCTGRTGGERCDLIGDTDGAVAARQDVVQGLQLARVGASEIHHREQRQAEDARRRLVDLDDDLLGREGNVIDALEADHLGACPKGEVHPEVERADRLHDRQAEVEVVDHQADGIRVDFRGDDLVRQRIAIDQAVAVVIYPVGPAHADEGMNVGGADGQELEVLRAFEERDRRVGWQAKVGQQAGHVADGLAEDSAAQLDVTHRPLLEGDAAGDVNELRDPQRDVLCRSPNYRLVEKKRLE